MGKCLGHRQGAQPRVLGALGFLFAHLLFFWQVKASAQDIPADLIFARGLEAISLEQAVAGVHPGMVVVLGEQHGTMQMASQQSQVIENIKKLGFCVSVAFEFFERQYQDSVDQWRRGEISEEQFLSAVHWGAGFPFAAYRQQALLPDLALGEKTIALNARRALTSKIAAQGLDGLSPAEHDELPPGFELGNEHYLTRFKETMGGHLPSPEALSRYFAAQSVWDDTMAFEASRFMATHPDQVLVIIVGEFHVQYGGGLPDRLRARGQTVKTFSLVNLAGYTPEEQKQLLEPSARDGDRADFVWTSRF